MPAAKYRPRRPTTKDASTSTEDLPTGLDGLSIPDLTYKSLLLLVFSMLLNRRVRREELIARLEQRFAYPPSPPPEPVPANTSTEVVALYVVNARVTRKCFFCNGNTTNVCGRCLQIPFCNTSCQESGFMRHEAACNQHLSRVRAAQAPRTTRPAAGAPRIGRTGRTARTALTARLAREARNPIPLGE